MFFLSWRELVKKSIKSRPETGNIQNGKSLSWEIF